MKKKTIVLTPMEKTYLQEYDRQENHYAGLKFWGQMGFLLGLALTAWIVSILFPEFTSLPVLTKIIIGVIVLLVIMTGVYIAMKVLDNKIEENTLFELYSYIDYEDEGFTEWAKTHIIFHKAMYGETPTSMETCQAYANYSVPIKYAKKHSYNF